MGKEQISEETNNNIEIIKDMLAGIQYGNIVISVQDGKIVQIDKTEKYRVRNWPDNRRFCRIYLAIICLSDFAESSVVFHLVSCIYNRKFLVSSITNALLNTYTHNMNYEKKNYWIVYFDAVAVGMA